MPAVRTAEHWRTRAACRSEDPDLFFPVGVTGAAIPQIAAAKAVCAGCPVREACGAFAIATNQEYGVWGGLDEEERREQRRRWRRGGADAAPAVAS
jgi:WhiB family redox-sensing transcriptional regulator